MSIIRQFKCRKSLLDSFYKAKTKPGWKIRDQHIEWIATWVENWGLRQFTLSQLREDFLLNFPNLGAIALSTLSNVLKKKVGMSFKKLGFLNPKQATETTPSEISNWSKIIEWFKRSSNKIIYVDEFSITRKTTSMYGWTKKGLPGWKILSPQTFKMSFVASMSQDGCEGVVGFHGTIDGDSFWSS